LISGPILAVGQLVLLPVNSPREFGFVSGLFTVVMTAVALLTDFLRAGSGAGHRPLALGGGVVALALVAAHFGADWVRQINGMQASAVREACNETRRLPSLAERTAAFKVHDANWTAQHPGDRLPHSCAEGILETERLEKNADCPEHLMAGVWVLVTIAMKAAGISSIEFTIDTRPPNVTMYRVFGISMVTAACGFMIEARRDLHASCMFVTVFAFITGAALGMEPHPVAAAVAVVDVLIVVACVVHMVRVQYGREVQPNLLRQQYHRSPRLACGSSSQRNSNVASVREGSGPALSRVADDGCSERDGVAVGRLPPDAVSVRPHPAPQWRPA